MTDEVTKETIGQRIRRLRLRKQGRAEEALDLFERATLLSIRHTGARAPSTRRSSSAPGRGASLHSERRLVRAAAVPQRLRGGRCGVAGDTVRPLPARDAPSDAELAARELGRLTLPDALALTVLIAEQEPARFGRAAVRWHGRFELEAKSVELPESQLALAALAAIPHDGEGALALLARIGARRGLRGLDGARDLDGR
jgi:hypothetical protein